MHELHVETIRQFKFIAEQIHKDAIDANKDASSYMKTVSRD